MKILWGPLKDSKKKSKGTMKKIEGSEKGPRNKAFGELELEFLLLLPSTSLMQVWNPCNGNKEASYLYRT